jgi:HAD superfamily hydrolase (TIGR01662 family)
MPIKAVCFDVGETLIDETRHWDDWAAFLGVPRLTLFSAYGVLLARGESLRRLFEIFRPDLDFAEVRRRRLAHYDFIHSDLYPDAIPALSELRDRGFRVVIAGNQPVESEAALLRLGVPADLIASSAGWGVQKPDPRFFEKVTEAAGVPAEQIAYVGDRVDNDVVPARAAGMTAVFLRRGPWGWMHEAHPQVDHAHLRVQSLLGLADALEALA